MADELVGPLCPECGDLCYYNGNYFCGSCDWTLPEGDVGDWFQEAYDTLMIGRDLKKLFNRIHNGKDS